MINNKEFIDHAISIKELFTTFIVIDIQVLYVHSMTVILGKIGMETTESFLHPLTTSFLQCTMNPFRNRTSTILLH